MTANAPAPASASARAPRIWSIRWIVTAAMVALVAAAVVSVGAFAERSARRALQEEMAAQLALQARNLAMVGESALLSEVPEWTLLPILKELERRQPDYAFAVVLDRQGTIVADAQARRLGQRFEPPAQLAPLAEAPEPIAGERLLGNAGLFVVSAPIRQPEGGELGSVWLGLRRSAVDRRLAAAQRQQLYVLGAFLLVGTAAALGLSSVMLRPIGALRAGLERIGRGDLETRLEVRDRTELGALAGAVNRMADELRNAQGELLERERISHEVQLARRIQLSLLPSARRVAQDFVIEGQQQAATEVGGDYFQILDLPGGRLGIVVADASGKGISGSLVTAMLHALLRSTAELHTSPAALLASLNGQILGMLERGSFVTMFYGILDLTDGRLVFASAGHNPLLVLRRSGQTEWVRARGAPLGALRGLKVAPKFEDVTVQIEPGDSALQYTDGITEAPGQNGSGQFGNERLAEVVARAAAGDCRALLDQTSQAVVSWRAGAEQHDDETLLVIRREAASAAAPADTQPGSMEVAMNRLEEAEKRGTRLTLPASRSALVRVDDWFSSSPDLAGLPGRSGKLLRLALHEACLNVVEHACGDDPSRTFDVWWVPEAGPEAGAGETARGFFLLRDQGQSFRYQDWQSPRVEDVAVRKRGRGFGLEIIRRVVDQIHYDPQTPAGNLTCLMIGMKQETAEEKCA